MAERSRNETREVSADAISGTAGNVALNVYVIFCVVQCIVMIITGAVYFDNCPGNIILNIYLIVHGVLLLSIPVLLWSVFRCGCKMKKVNYYTACVTAGIVCTGWLIAGSSFLAVAECKSSTVYRISLGFNVVTWLFYGICIPILCWVRYCTGRE
ncbi:uncharacterized protein LOC124277528 isoform X2 [Haliotis rubra]|uniref:uncharacterized protein LOC124277528 isoform X2 n=1 Tax=Haliotis rubra TaxID=36100 RepID=UPI001EE51ECA|nr:uncharacterized protein LOC124277528 isoform X2 [Haliotis rubra]